MRKLICLVCFMIFPVCLFAQETLTISTYYPTPYGSYRHLQLVATDSPDTCDSAEELGMMYFDLSESKMKVCNLSGGSYAWRDLGGASSYSFTYWCGVPAGTVTPACVDAGGTQGFCPAGSRQVKALGAWGECILCGGGVTSDHSYPPGMGCSGCGGGGINGYAYACAVD